VGGAFFLGGFAAYTFFGLVTLTDLYVRRAGLSASAELLVYKLPNKNSCSGKKCRIDVQKFAPTENFRGVI